MIGKVLFPVVLLCAAFHSQATSLPVADMDGLKLKYADAIAVDHYNGHPLHATVKSQEGQAYQFFSSVRVQQMEYLVPNGTEVAMHQAIIRLTGSEVHHFRERVAVARNIMALAKQRYEKNKPLYQSKSISEASWLAINRQYQDAKLALGHLNHFYELVISTSKDGESIVLGAPSAGILRYASSTQRQGEEALLATIIPPKALRLNMHIPLSKAKQLTELKTPQCTVKVDNIGQYASGLFVSVWSQPLGKQCGLMAGQMLMVQPQFNTTGYLVPKKAVFRYQRHQQVAVLDGDKLTVQPVEIIATQENYYVVSSPETLVKKQILTSSIGAVEGMLVGMGGE